MGTKSYSKVMRKMKNTGKKAKVSVTQHVIVTVTDQPELGLLCDCDCDVTYIKMKIIASVKLYRVALNRGELI